MSHPANCGSARARSSRGISLIELMVAMTLSLILLAGVVAIFLSSRTTYETTDRLSRIQESGRFALDVLMRDLRAAGYVGCSRRAAFTNALNVIDDRWDFSAGIRGYDAQGNAWQPNPNPSVDAVAPSAAGGSDILIVRLPRHEIEPIRVVDRMNDTTETVLIPDVAPALIEANDIVQISDCEGRSVFQVSGNAAGELFHDEGGTPGNASEDLGYAFSDSAEVLPMQTVVYFLRDSGAGSALWRTVNGGIAEELVEGVENMQIIYGQRIGSGIQYRRADQVTDWTEVVTVRIALLVRSLSEYGTDTDDQEYDLLGGLGATIPSPGDRRMRQVFTTTVNIRNASS